MPSDGVLPRQKPQRPVGAEVHVIGNPAAGGSDGHADGPERPRRQQVVVQRNPGRSKVLHTSLFVRRMYEPSLRPWIETFEHSSIEY